jgi:hypothetical protein
VRVLRLLTRVDSRAIEVRVDRPWRDDLRTLLCARHLALSRSSLTTLLLTNPRLRTLYMPVLPGADVWTASCRTRVWAIEAPRARRWSAAPAQMLQLVTAGWNGTAGAFQRRRVSCLNITARGAEAVTTGLDTGTASGSALGW